MPVEETKVNQVLLHLEGKCYRLTVGKVFRNFSPKFLIFEAQIETILPQDQVTVVHENGFKILPIFFMEQG